MLGQQRSERVPEQLVMGTWRQVTSQCSGSPTSSSVVQGSPSSGQVVGQVVLGSQVSPAPTCLSPHLPAQSLSLSALQPGGQQPSSFMQPTMGAWVQRRVQLALDPLARSVVQASSSSQVRAQAPGSPAVIARSQASPASTAPSPQTGVQSGSLAAVQPAGQQLSPEVQAVIGTATHEEVQLVGDPRKVSVMQVPSEGQTIGQEAGSARSQVSTGRSTTPLPHIAAQSASTVRSPPGGQQPSPATNAVTGRCTQAAEQVPAESSRSLVQGSRSLHAFSQAPGAPAAIETSQVSFGWTTPSPQVDEQSGSVAAVQPVGQQPSLAALQPAMGLSTQAAEQSSVLPVSAVWRQAESEGGQLVGQAPLPAATLSQVSPGSTMPSPHVAGQSVSVACVAPDGQQPSPEIGASMVV